MGRYKHRKDAALPAYVGRVKSKNRVIWREYLGQGRFGRVVTLRNEEGEPLPYDASHKLILAAYNSQVTSVTTRNLRWLIEEYFKGRHYKTLSENTQRSYQVFARTMCSIEMRNGRTLGDAPLKALSPPTFSQYRDKRSEETPVSANRELQFIRAVFTWGIEYGKCSSNPAKGVRLNPSNSRTRYVEDEELELLKKCSSERLVIVLELAYLLRARAGEILALRPSNIKEEGVLLVRSKRSDSEVTLWSDRLRTAIDQAMAMPGRNDQYIIHDEDGEQVTYSAIRSAYVRAMEKALKNGLKEKFTLHDLKAKGITDHKTNHGGHRSERMRQVYVRKAEKVESTR